MRRARGIVGAVIAAWLVVSATSARGGPVSEVAAVEITVGDLDRAVAFYTGVLDFELVSEVEAAGEEWERLRGVFALRMRSARLRLGQEEVWLTECLAPQGMGIPEDSRSNDQWFQHIAIVVSDMDAAYARLRGADVRHASSGPQRLPDWNVNAGGIEAFYFKDPEGHVLEVIAYPEGKGDARWQEKSERLFLGIDHTAIVVRDTERALRFYRDALGMRIAGESENHGPEQERLNGVFGARLRITALRAERGPGVELLEYLSPSDGRSADASTCACDLAQWRTRLVVDDLEAVERTLRAERADLLSPGFIDVPDDALGFDAGVLARDPDGHAVEFVTKTEGDGR